MVESPPVKTKRINGNMNNVNNNANVNVNKSGKFNSSSLLKSTAVKHRILDMISSNTQPNLDMISNNTQPNSVFYHVQQHAELKE